MLRSWLQRILLRVTQPQLLRRRPAMAIILIIHLICGALLLRLELNNAPELYFPSDAPATVLERELRAEFPNDEILIALFEGDDLYSSEVLGALDRVAGRMEAHPDVDRVFSVTRVDHIAGSADGFVVEPLIDPERLDEGTADERLQRVLADRFMPGWLASRDGKVLALVVRTHKLQESRQRQSVEQALYDAVGEEAVGERLTAVAGTVALDAAQLRSMVRDTLVFTPLVMGLGLALLYWVVGRIVPIVIGAVAMSTVVIACVGLVAALGLPYTLVTAMIPTLLSAYTVGNLLHLYAALKRMRDAGFRRPKRVVFALQSMHSPAMFNVLTTAAGMISLVLVPIPPIQVFGAISAVGVLVIYFVVFYLVPPLLVKYDRGPWPKSGGGFAWTKRISYAFASFGMRRAGWVVGGAVVLAVAAIPLALKVQAESDLLKFFTASHPLTQSTDRVERTLVGVTALEIVIDGPGRDAFKDAKRLQAIKALQMQVEALPEVDRSLSMMDIVEEMHWAFNEEDEAFRRLPDDDRLLSQLLLIYDGRDLQELVNNEYQRMRILLNVNVHGANEIQGVIDRIEALIATVDDPALKWELAGYGRLFADQEDLLVVGQLHSFLGAFGQIFLIMFLLWRSLPAAVIGMIPNLAPLFFVFTLMGGTGIPLDMATVLIAGVVLGITVDDTIHLFHNYLARREQGRSVVFSVARSFEASGRAVVAISLLLVSQFLLLGTSSFVPTSNFGLLTATGLLAGQLMELLMLPALLVLWGRFRTRHRFLSA
ncbi:RND efflux transporter [Thauera humireducens]|uniref:efflux RND transporter permease subunit n=1 Tax=Thauera humireducens TaxID=1134435 RepID=UPI002467A671|nr:MMPL family transporter [Thauera humireducens]CAH1745546.1 RND efflux transporter [Thauera humireducens]